MEIKNSQIRKVYNQAKDDLDGPTPDVSYIKKTYLDNNGGLLSELFSKLKDLAPQERASYGKEVNTVKQYIQDRITQIELANADKEMLYDRIDPTAPYDINTEPSKRPELPNGRGTQHPLTSELETITEIFESMGFIVEDSRQLDNDYNMFGALNFPEGHPARDMWDTFWTEEKLIPPAHTSTMQNRILRKYDTPIRVVIPGRCFRNEATDASHEHTLHQIEGVYVDENINLGHMISTIKTYLEGFFGQELEYKIQPAFYPFTEPSMEFMISCPFCNAKGCSVCGRSGWIEAMGCGMIHPNVLKEGGIDPEKYSGFAWGFGLDRLVMIKNQIHDIRWLHSGDLEFLKQF